MWHQQSSTASHIDDPNLVSDCASGPQSTGRYPHGIPTHSGVAYTEQQQLCKRGKGQQDVSEIRDLTSQSCTKSYADSLYDSSRTDSGFLSEANIVSDQCLSEEIKSRDLTHQDSSSEGKEVSTKNDMRLDSGVDVGLSSTFNTLSIKNTSSLNDLNSSLSRSVSVDSSVPLTNINVLPSSSTTHSSATDTPKQPEPQNVAPAWELYFQQDEDGDTQLHIAIIQGFIEVVYSLILMSPHPCFLDIQNDGYQTPLHLAVLTRQSKIVRRLLVAGATVDMRDRAGNTPLHLACQVGDLECVKVLTEPVTVAETRMANLQYMQTTRPQQLPQNLEERNYEGQTCVHLASLNSHVDVLRHLVWFGANINAREAKSGRTALHYAVEMSLTRLLHFLLSECPVQLEASTYAGHTAYQLAACVDSALARQLSEHGAQPRPLPDDSDSDSDSDDDGANDDEMYQKPSDDNFTSLRINGQPIDISA